MLSNLFLEIHLIDIYSILYHVIFMLHLFDALLYATSDSKQDKRD